MSVRVRLIPIDGPILGEAEIVLSMFKPLRIGRCPPAELPIPVDPRISTEHLTLEATLEGCRITDLNSTNGTFVNGKRIQEIVAHDGDSLRAGHSIWQVMVEALEPAPRTAPISMDQYSALEQFRRPTSNHGSYVAFDNAAGSATDDAPNLIVTTGDNRLIKLLPSDRRTFGRTDLAEIQFMDLRMSSCHFAIYFENGRWYAVDQQSTNGLFCNGERIQRAELQHGDRLIAGSTEFQIGFESVLQTQKSARPNLYQPPPITESDVPFVMPPPPTNSNYGNGRPTPITQVEQPANNGYGYAPQGFAHQIDIPIPPVQNPMAPTETPPFVKPLPTPAAETASKSSNSTAHSSSKAAANAKNTPSKSAGQVNKCYDGSIKILADNQRTFPLTAEQTATVGSDATCDIELGHDPAVAKQHATLLMTGGMLIIEDLGSPVGTLVDGDRVTTKVLVPDGTLLQFGDTVMLFCNKPYTPSSDSDNELNDEAQEQTIAKSPIVQGSIPDPMQSNLQVAPKHRTPIDPAVVAAKQLQFEEKIRYRGFHCASGLRLYRAAGKKFDQVEVARRLLFAAPGYWIDAATIEKWLEQAKAGTALPPDEWLLAASPDDAGWMLPLSQTWGSNTGVLGLTSLEKNEFKSSLLKFRDASCADGPTSLQPKDLADYLNGGQPNEVEKLFQLFDAIYLELNDGEQWGLFARPEFADVLETLQIQRQSRW